MLYLHLFFNQRKKMGFLNQNWSNFCEKLTTSYGIVMFLNYYGLAFFCFKLNLQQQMAPLFQEVILAADLRCAKCQEKIAKAISRVDIDVESMEVNVSKKNVILTCKPVREEEGSSSRKASAACNNLSSKTPATAWFPSYN